MPMADSLIERAKEVATSGTVDEAFKVREICSALEAMVSAAEVGSL